MMNRIKFTLFVAGGLLYASAAHAASSCGRYPGVSNQLIAQGSEPFFASVTAPSFLATIGNPKPTRRESTFADTYYELEYPYFASAELWISEVSRLPGVSTLSANSIACFAASPPVPKVTVVEFYNTNLGHYFYTRDEGEINAIRNGAAGAGWQTTGHTFSGYGEGWQCGQDLSYVARFYGPASNSHFFTLDRGECGALIEPGTGWTPEGISFAAVEPKSGSCDWANATNTQRFIPVHRLYNNRFAQNDSNHRYTTSRAVVDEMKAKGWIYEGVTMCAPEQ